MYVFSVRGEVNSTEVPSFTLTKLQKKYYKIPILRYFFIFALFFLPNYLVIVLQLCRLFAFLKARKGADTLKVSTPFLIVV